MEDRNRVDMGLRYWWSIWLRMNLVLKRKSVVWVIIEMKWWLVNVVSGESFIFFALFMMSWSDLSLTSQHPLFSFSHQQFNLSFSFLLSRALIAAGLFVIVDGFKSNLFLKQKRITVKMTKMPLDFRCHRIILKSFDLDLLMWLGFTWHHLGRLDVILVKKSLVAICSSNALLTKTANGVPG